MLTETTETTAAVIHINIDRRGVRSVVIKCPYCKRLHIHGWPLAQRELGHRGAHCAAGRGTLGYIIELPRAPRRATRASNDRTANDRARSG